MCLLPAVFFFRLLRLITVPEQVADGIEQLVDAGFGGTGLSFVNYAEEFPYFAETVLPILEKRGIRNIKR